MSANLLSEIDTDIFRKNLLKYTRKAYQLLPKINNPRILDIGCGSGVPTIELAKLTKGKIVAIDTNQTLLNKLNKKIKSECLSKQVITKNQSFFDIDFPDESFDIIWAEGIMNVIGFETNLENLRKLLKPFGFLVIHDGIKNISNKLKKIPNFGFKLLYYFELPEFTWWKAYYQPLEQLLKQLKRKHKNEAAKKILDKYQAEVDMFKRNPKDNNSAFYILQKI